MKERWFSENLHNGFRQSLLIDKLLFEGRTDFQDALIFENSQFGRVLVLDNIIQTTERDDFCYHEMLVHVPIIAHGSVEHVLIIGGGDGGALREAVKHPNVKITMIELDKKVVEICKKYIHGLSDGAFEDERTEIKFMNGVKFVQETVQKFDIVIVDSTDPIGPGLALFSYDFYKACGNCLTEQGILVTQNGVTFLQEEEIRNSFKQIDKIYRDSTIYITQVPTYSGGFMAFGWGSHSPKARKTQIKKIQQRIKGLKLNTRYYSAKTHIASFKLPPYIQALKN